MLKKEGPEIHLIHLFAVIHNNLYPSGKAFFY